jgi:hypothetical protein
VERAGLHAADAEPAQARAHLSRGARRERDGQDLTRRDVPGGDQVRDAAGDGAGLAGAGAGEDADRAARGGDGGQLFVVQSRSWAVEHHTRHPRITG